MNVDLPNEVAMCFGCRDIYKQAVRGYAEN